jgi:tRNA-2-methylthio-N6-dimethylallyladenosine synthase
VEVEVTHAAPHHLLSDVAPAAYRRTRAGDAWEARQGRTEVRSVGLGMPTIGAPEPVGVPSAGCSF